MTWWRWLARKVCAVADRNELPVVVLGKALRPDPELIARSSAALLVHDLDELGQPATWWDPQADRDKMPRRRAVFVIMVPYRVFADPRIYPTGSVVIDPYRYVAVNPGVELIRWSYDSERERGPVGDDPPPTGQGQDHAASRAAR